MALSTPAPRCISWEQAWSVRDTGSNLGAGSCSNHIKAPHYHRANLTCRDTAFMFTCTCRFIYKYIFLHIYRHILTRKHTFGEKSCVSNTKGCLTTNTILRSHLQLPISQTCRTSVLSGFILLGCRGKW